MIGELHDWSPVTWLMSTSLGPSEGKWYRYLWQSSSQKAESKNARPKERESIKHQHCASRRLPPHDRTPLIWGGQKGVLYLTKHASVEGCWSKCRASKLPPVPTSTPPFPFLKLCQELLNWITCDKKASDRAFLNFLVNSSDTAILQPGSEIRSFQPVRFSIG